MPWRDRGRVLKGSLAWVALVALTSPLFAGCLEGSGSAKAALGAEAPDWAAGHTFSYEWKAERTFTETLKGGKGSVKTEAGPLRYSMEVLNTTLKDRNKDAMYLVSGTPENRTTAAGADEFAYGWFLSRKLFAFRQADLMPTYVSYPSQYTCPVVSSCAQKLDFYAEPNLTFIQFPLTEDKTWETSIPSEQMQYYYAMGTKATGRVVGASKVKVPAGTFSAVEVELVLTPTDMDKYIQYQKNQSKKNGYVVEKHVEEMRIVYHLWYSPEVQGLVKSVVESESRREYYARGTMPGQTDEVDDQREQARAEEVLVSYSLTSGPERGLKYIFDEVLELAPKKDQPVAEVYDLLIRSDEYGVNAADRETITFSLAVLSSSRQIPSKHSVRWALIDSAGAVVATAKGEELSHLFDEPGSYWVYVESRDAAGQKVASATSTFIVYYQARRIATCPVAGAEPYSPGCAPVSLPVRPGAYYLHVAAKIYGELLASDGELRLVDGHGTLVESVDNNGSGSYSMMLSSELAQADDKDWTLQWYQRRGVLEDATFDVSISYGHSGLAKEPTEYPASSPPPLAVLGVGDWASVGRSRSG